MFARLVLAFVLAVPPFVFLLATSTTAATNEPFWLHLRMSATSSGVVQAFFDTGDGFQPHLSASAMLEATEDPRDYRLPLPTGSYRAIRIDPAMAPGRYTIEAVSILDAAGSVYTEIPLMDLFPSYQLVAVEMSPRRLVVDCPAGAFDPQLVYTPPTRLVLAATFRSLPALLGRFGLYFAVALLLVWALERLCRPWAPRVRDIVSAWPPVLARHPQAFVIVAAFAGTVAATYPVALLGRSFVSPANGHTPLLYGGPPFAPGVRYVQIEDVRRSDVGAMMWAFVPYSSVQRDALRQGEIPLWNRYNGIGRPLWGQGQSFMLDPLHWLTLVGSDRAPAWDLKFLAHRFVFAWGIGVAALVTTGAWLPAGLSAATAPFIGLFAYRFNHPAAFTVTYAPWILVAWFLLARAEEMRQQARAGLFLVCAASLLLFASPPKEAVVMSVACHGVGLITVLLATRARRRFLFAFGLAIVAGLATTLITAPQWLILLDTLRASFTYYDEPAVQFATRDFAVGFVLGPLTPGSLFPAVQPLTVALLAAACASPSRLASRPPVVACLLGASALVFVAFGGLPAAWLRQVPFLANIHFIHATFLTASIVLLTVAGAAGLADLLSGSVAVARVAATVTLLVAALVLAQAGGIAALGRFEEWMIPLALGGASLAPLILCRAALTFPRVLPCVAAAALSALIVLPGGQHLDAHIPPIDRLLVQPQPRPHLDAGSPAVNSVHRAASGPSRVVGLGFSLFAGSQALYDLESLNGPDALQLRAFDEVFDAIVHHPRDGWRPVIAASDLATDAPMLDMLNVGHVLARFDEVPSNVVTEPLPGPDRLLAVPRPTAWPRAFFVDRLGEYATPLDLMQQIRARGRPLAAMETGDVAAEEVKQRTEGGTGVVVQATDYKLTVNTTTFRVRAPGRGVAVLGEAFMPDDFVATLNGERVPYFRVNHVFKAVAIPGAGDWHVRFEYRPARWTMALAAAIAGLLVLCGLTVASLPHRLAQVSARVRAIRDGAHE